MLTFLSSQVAPVPKMKLNNACFFIFDVVTCQEARNEADQNKTSTDIHNYASTKNSEKFVWFWYYESAAFFQSFGFVETAFNLEAWYRIAIIRTSTSEVALFRNVYIYIYMQWCFGTNYLSNLCSMWIVKFSLSLYFWARSNGRWCVWTLPAPFPSLRHCCFSGFAHMELCKANNHILTN